MSTVEVSPKRHFSDTARLFRSIYSGGRIRKIKEDHKIEGMINEKLHWGWDGCSTREMSTVEISPKRHFSDNARLFRSIYSGSRIRKIKEDHRIEGMINEKLHWGWDGCSTREVSTVEVSPKRHFSDTARLFRSIYSGSRIRKIKEDHRIEGMINEKLH
ncbi:hypothetical protein RB195_007952 [Necator americanus]|uniref:Uncharacterized protein n=1 Tax=Necator americanus TaxID=51031 RepID=A0ABR1C294_NECAM